MDLLSLWTASAAALASAAYMLRSNMLKPEQTAWPNAPWAVIVPGLVQGVVLGGYAFVTGIGRHRPDSYEALIVTACAVYAVPLAANLYRQHRARELWRRDVARGTPAYAIGDRADRDDDATAGWPGPHF